MPSQRLKTIFHESFSLSRPSLNQIIGVAQESASSDLRSQEKRFDILRKKTNLGTNYIKAMPKYAIGTGLLDASYNLTQFGKFSSEFDFLLERKSTLWLMHYHLSALQGPGPAFWHHIVKVFFRSGNEFSSSDIAEEISSFYHKEEGDTLSERSARTTATILLGSYTKSDALGPLNLVQGTGNDRFRINDDLDAPPTWAVAYSVVDTWLSLYPERKGVNLDDFTSEDGVTNIFLIGSGKFANILQKMQSEGFVEVYRVAPPYQVVLLQPELTTILGKVYEDEQST